MSTGERLLVIGVGNSGMDIACDACKLAKNVSVVTRHGEGYPSDMASAQQSGLHWVAPDDPDALAQAVAKLATHPEQLADEGERAFRSYARYLSNQRIRGELAAALATLGINSPACG